MEYPESLEKAGGYARSAFSLMESKAISATPNNFAVWFVYYSGRHPDLTRALDKLIEENEEFTEARNAALALIRETGETHIPVVGDMDSMTFSGTVHERDVLDAYNRALLQTRREERGE